MRACIEGIDAAAQRASLDTLRGLNDLLPRRRFRMETSATLRQLLQQGQLTAGPRQ